MQEQRTKIVKIKRRTLTFDLVYAFTLLLVVIIVEQLQKDGMVYLISFILMFAQNSLLAFFAVKIGRIIEWKIGNKPRKGLI